MLLGTRLGTAFIFAHFLVGPAHPDIDDDYDGWQKSAWPPDSSSLMPFEQLGRYGYVDGKGRVVIPPRFRFAYPFYSEGSAVVVESTHAGRNVDGYIDSNGNFRFQAYQFDNGADPFFDGFARFVENGKIGFIDKGLKVRIPAQFDHASYFRWGWAGYCEGCKKAARLGSPDFQSKGPYRKAKWGIVDTLGNRITPPIYSAVVIVSKDRARACMTCPSGDDDINSFEGDWIDLDRMGRQVNPLPSSRPPPKADWHAEIPEFGRDVK